MPSSPSAPSSGHRSRGNTLVRSISAARGAIRSWAKRAVVSRSNSTSCPRLKSNPVQAFGIMAPPTTAEHRSPDGAQRNPGLLQPEPRRGDAEEGEKADDIGDRGDERAGGDRRIDAEPDQHQGDHDAAE